MTTRTDSEAMTAIAEIMRQHGFAGTYFCRGDVEGLAGRELTDAEWEAVHGSWYWRKGIADHLAENGWEMVREAMADADVAESEEV